MGFILFGRTWLRILLLTGACQEDQDSGTWYVNAGQAGNAVDSKITTLKRIASLIVFVLNNNCQSFFKGISKLSPAMEHPPKSQQNRGKRDASQTKKGREFCFQRAVGSFLGSSYEFLFWAAFLVFDKGTGLRLYFVLRIAYRGGIGFVFRMAYFVPSASLRARLRIAGGG